MHSLAVYVKKRLPFATELPLENSADSNLCFELTLLHSVSSFSCINHFLCVCFYARFFLIQFHLTQMSFSQLIC